MISKVGILLDLLFPKKCLSCHKNITDRDSAKYPFLGELICISCFDKIPLHHTLFCGACGARLPYGGKICHMKTPYLLGAATDYHATPEIHALIHTLKFRSNEKAALPLGELLIRYTRGIGILDNAPTIIPIPLSKKRERERGFNQSLLLARMLSEALSARLYEDVLLRTIHRAPQSSTKSKAERFKNIQDVFEVRMPERIKNKTIILVDDVRTTGATLEESSLALKKAGAKKIIGLTVAKT